MNVYVRQLGSALAQAGLECITYTRADRPGLAPEIVLEPGHRLVHIEAGPYDLAKEDLPSILDEFTRGVGEHIASIGGVDAIHANYWLSGVVGHRLKHELDIPFVTTFHTLARVKAAHGHREPAIREQYEADIIRCADAIFVSCREEEEQFRALYGDPEGRIEIVAPGVERAFFSPGDRAGARRAIDLADDVPVVVFVGRIQPLKGPDLAVRALAELEHDTAVLLIIGGASGREGTEETARLVRLVAELGLGERVRFIEPQPHHTLSTYYRAADVVIVPSHTESFGLVALEAAACGVPVVASAVGGLRSIVEDRRTGILVEDRSPATFAAAIDEIITEPVWAGYLADGAAVRSERYTWGFAAARARRAYLDLLAREPVVCS